MKSRNRCIRKLLGFICRGSNGPVVYHWAEWDDYGKLSSLDGAWRNVYGHASAIDSNSHGIRLEGSKGEES